MASWRRGRQPPAARRAVDSSTAARADPSPRHMPSTRSGAPFPATQVPLGLSGEGLPLGVQVISGPGNDHVTIAVAEELERIFGGWVPPF